MLPAVTEHEQSPLSVVWEEVSPPLFLFPQERVVIPPPPFLFFVTNSPCEKQTLEHQILLSYRDICSLSHRVIESMMKPVQQFVNGSISQ